MSSQSSTSEPLSRSDKFILALLAFFTIFNLTMDLYWVLYARELVARAHTDFIAYLYSLYGPADRAYFDQPTPFSLSLEGINVFFTTWLNGWLAWAILRRKAYRHGLQLALGSYLSYSVILYFLAAHLSGYAGMPEKKLAAFVLFYGASLPWLLAHLYMVCHSWTAIVRRFSGGRLGPAYPVPFQNEVGA